jgi:hypothetical protein
MVVSAAMSANVRASDLLLCNACGEGIDRMSAACDSHDIGDQLIAPDFPRHRNI